MGDYEPTELDIAHQTVLQLLYVESLDSLTPERMDLIIKRAWQFSRKFVACAKSEEQKT